METNSIWYTFHQPVEKWTCWIFLYWRCAFV